MAASASPVSNEIRDNNLSDSIESRSFGELVVNAKYLKQLISEVKADINYDEAKQAIKIFLDHSENISKEVVNRSSIDQLADILARVEKIKNDSETVSDKDLLKDVKKLSSFTAHYRSMLECAQMTSDAIIPQLISKIESAELTQERINAIKSDFALLRNFEFLSVETKEVRDLAADFFARAETAITEKAAADRKEESLQQIFQLANVFNLLGDTPNQAEIERAKASVKKVLEEAISVELLSGVDLEELLVLSSDEEEADTADTSFMIQAFSTIKDGVIDFLKENDFDVENSNGIMTIKQRREEEILSETESVEPIEDGFGTDVVETSDDQNINFSEILNDLGNLENNLVSLTGNADFAATVAKYMNGNPNALLPAVKIAVASEEDLFNYVREQLDITGELLVTDDNVEEIIQLVASCTIANATF